VIGRRARVDTGAQRRAAAREATGPVGTLPLAIANGWASGLGAYATVFIAGVLGRAGIAQTPAGLQRTDVLAVVTAVGRIPWIFGGAHRDPRNTPWLKRRVPRSLRSVGRSADR
jgi:hypothetical protein